MKRYIDATELLNEFHRYAYDTEDLHIDLIEDVVNDAPTADVVEVVRCKDCRWWDNEDNAERCTHKYGGMWAKSDGYCSYGERTEE